MEEQTTSVVIEQQGEQKKRGALAVILAVAFVAMLGIGTTFAYLTYVGNQTPNRFTTDRGLTVDVLEPAWTAGVEAGNYEYPNIASDGIAIPATANNMSETTGHQVVAKDPFVVNTSKVGNESDPGKNAYVGIRLTFQKWVATSATGNESDHTEEGHYVTMDDREVKALLKVYALAADTSAISTSADDLRTEPGLSLGTGWSQVNYETGAVVTTEGQGFGSSTNGAMYFVYNNSLVPVGDLGTTDATADMNTKATASSLSGKKASSTALFNKVVYCNNADTGDDTAVANQDDYRSTLANYLNKGKFKGTKEVTKNGKTEEVELFEDNATTDPGWRVIVSTAAIEDTNEAAGVADQAAMVKKINQAYTELAEDGSNATGSKKGSGWRSEFDNPESTWTR